MWSNLKRLKLIGHHKLKWVLNQLLWRRTLWLWWTPRSIYLWGTQLLNTKDQNQRSPVLKWGRARCQTKRKQSQMKKGKYSIIHLGQAVVLGWAGKVSRKLLNLNKLHLLNIWSFKWAKRFMKYLIWKRYLNINSNRQRLSLLTLY